MHRMKSAAARKSTAVVLLALAVTACTETSGPTGEITSDAHNTSVVMGGFHINTVPVTTNADGQSKNIVDDYVTPAQLPDLNYETFSIHLLAPTASDVTTNVDNVRVRVLRTDGGRTNNILLGVQYEGETSLGGKRYDVYQIDGFYNASPALNKSNFANVTFEADLEYEANGNRIASREITLSVYKRN